MKCLMFMKKLLPVIVLSVLFTLTEFFIVNTRIPQEVHYTGPTVSIEQQHAATHRVGVFQEFEGEVGHCSGTAIGPHAILTAQHCFRDSNQIRLDADKEPTTILAAFVDGNDHVIYLVNREFKVWVSIDQRKLSAGERVHFWGNPGMSTDILRTGVFVKIGLIPEVSSRVKLQIFILPVFRGDSGSGLFDEDGNIVAVLSMGDESAHEWSIPLAFSPAQLNIAAR